jgi:hypothetical protein
MNTYTHFGTCEKFIRENNISNESQREKLNTSVGVCYSTNTVFNIPDTYYAAYNTFSLRILYSNPSWLKDFMNERFLYPFQLSNISKQSSKNRVQLIVLNTNNRRKQELETYITQRLITKYNKKKGRKDVIFV